MYLLRRLSFTAPRVMQWIIFRENTIVVGLAVKTIGQRVYALSLLFSIFDYELHIWDFIA